MARIPTSDLPTVSSQGASYKAQATDRSVIQGIEKLGQGAINIVKEVNKRKVETELQNSKFDYANEQAELVKGIDVAIAKEDPISFNDHVSELNKLNEYNKEKFVSYGKQGRNTYSAMSIETAKIIARKKAKYEISGLQNQVADLKLNLSSSRDGIIKGNAFSKDTLNAYYGSINESGMDADDKKKLSQSSTSKFYSGFISSVENKGWNKEYSEAASIISSKLKDGNLKKAFQTKVAEARVEYDARQAKRLTEAPAKAAKFGSSANGEAAMQDLAVTIVQAGGSAVISEEAKNKSLTKSYSQFHAKNIYQDASIVKGLKTDQDISNYVESLALIGNPDKLAIKNAIQKEMINFHNTANKAQALVDTDDDLKSFTKVASLGQSAEALSTKQIAMGVPKTQVKYHTKDTMAKAGADWAQATATISDGTTLRQELNNFIPADNSRSMYALSDITLNDTTRSNNFPKQAMAAYMLGDGAKSAEALELTKNFANNLEASGVSKKELISSARKEVYEKFPAAPKGHPNNGLRESLVHLVAADSIDVADKSIDLNTAMLDNFTIISGTNNSSIVLTEEPSTERKLRLSTAANDPVGTLTQLHATGRGLDIVKYLGKMPGDLLIDAPMKDKTAYQKKATLAKNAYERGDLRAAYEHFAEITGDSISFSNAYNSGDTTNTAPSDIGLFIGGVGVPLEGGATLSMQDIDLLLGVTIDTSMMSKDLGVI